eukprot:SM000074S21698  [mRNA]  locus=s74:390579:391123:- [translate_table: standard]
MGLSATERKRVSECFLLFGGPGTVAGWFTRRRQTSDARRERRSGSPTGGKSCEKPARKELTRFEEAKLRAKQRLRGLKRLWQNGGGLINQ